MSMVKEMRRSEDDGKLTTDRVCEILEEEGLKEVKQYKLVFYNRIICKLLEDCPSVTQREERIIRGLFLVAKRDKEREQKYIEEQRQKEEGFKDVAMACRTDKVICFLSRYIPAGRHLRFHTTVTDIQDLLIMAGYIRL
jgi:hypothetical protein